MAVDLPSAATPCRRPSCAKRQEDGPLARAATPSSCVAKRSPQVPLSLPPWDGGHLRWACSPPASPPAADAAGDPRSAGWAVPTCLTALPRLSKGQLPGATTTEEGNLRGGWGAESPPQLRSAPARRAIPRGSGERTKRRDGGQLPSGHWHLPRNRATLIPQQHLVWAK